jgi:hypothetical protein
MRSADKWSAQKRVRKAGGPGGPGPMRKLFWWDSHGEACPSADLAG